MSEVIELTESDFIEETILIGEEQMLIGDQYVEIISKDEFLTDADWDSDLSIIFSEDGKSTFQKSTKLSQLKVGAQFVYRGEVCTKLRAESGTAAFFNVEASSGFLYLNPDTVVNFIQ